MNNVGPALDRQTDNLELEWRLAYDASIAARAEYHRLAAEPSASVESLDTARERLERADAAKARTMWKIQRIEAGMTG
jgi:hypothetical protein